MSASMTTTQVLEIVRKVIDEEVARAIAKIEALIASLPREDEA
jgi:hypothetical protein